MTADGACMAGGTQQHHLRSCFIGGDGSVNELASALVTLDAPQSTAMAVIPLGTANDFATSLGIPEVKTLGDVKIAQLPARLLPRCGCSSSSVERSL